MMRRFSYKRRRFSRRQYWKPYRNSLRRRKAYSSIRNRNPVTADVLFVKLKYNYNGSVTGGATSETSYKWRGNSLYDPDVTSTGTQPMGYDQYSTFYDYCTVLGSKITLRILPGADTVCQFCVYPQTISASTAVGQALREVPYGRTATGGIYNIQGNQFVKLRNYMSTSRMFCVSKQEIKDNVLFTHTSGTNPVDVWFWILTAQTQGGAVASSLNFTFDVQIDYYVMFKRRTQLTVS